MQARIHPESGEFEATDRLFVELERALPADGNDALEPALTRARRVFSSTPTPAPEAGHRCSGPSTR